MYTILNQEFTDGYQNIEVEILSLNKIAEPASMYLVHKRLCYDRISPQGQMKPYVNVFKVQFLASAKLSISDDMVLAAGYISKESGRIQYWFNCLPKGYDQDLGEAKLVDYQSYLETCKLMNGSPQSFEVYVEEQSEDLQLYPISE